MFYEKLQSLCAKNGISATKMCQEIGLATSAPVRWKSTQRKYSKAKDRLATLFRTDIRNIHISDLNAVCADLTYNSAHAVRLGSRPEHNERGDAPHQPADDRALQAQQGAGDARRTEQTHKKRAGIKPAFSFCKGII